MKRNLLDRFVISILIWCLFSFKVPLIGVESTFIRPDDVMILMLAILFMLSGVSRRTKIPHAALPFFLFTGFSVLSSLYNGVIGRVDTVSSVLFSIRGIEYFIFFYIGSYLASREINLYMIMKYYLYFLVVLVPLQMIGVIPVFGGFDASRASGNTNGPYELAAVAAFLGFYFYFDTAKSKARWKIATAILFTTASRITNFGFWLLMFFQFYRRWSIKFILLISLCGILAFAISPLLENDKSQKNEILFLQSRFTSLASSTGLLDTLSGAYQLIGISKNKAEFLDNDYVNPLMNVQTLSGDASTYIRLYRWIALLKSTFHNVDSALIGLGPSFSSVAVDGYYVRVVAETGLIGLALFIWFLFSCLKWGVRDKVFSNYLITLMISALAIDIFVAYKAMMLFWLYFGWVFARGREANN